MTQNIIKASIIDEISAQYKFIDTEYGKIFYMHKEGSSRYPIILIHGLGFDTKSWSKTIEELNNSNKDFDIYAIDLLGHGNSDAPKDIDYKVNVQVEILKEFVEKLNLNPVIVGHSYGGWVTSLYAAFGYKAKALVLEDAGGFYESSELHDKNMEEGKEEIYKGVMRVEGNHDHVIRGILYADNKEFYLNKEILSKIKVPTLIIWGEDDKSVPIEIWYKFHEYIKNSRFEKIPNSGHVSHYSKSEEFSKILIDFYNNLKDKDLRKDKSI